jgi:hypothetical protein
VFTAQLGNRHATFGLAQDRKDLGFAKSRHLHQILLRYLAEKILRPHPLSFEEDYRAFSRSLRLRENPSQLRHRRRRGRRADLRCSLQK